MTNRIITVATLLAICLLTLSASPQSKPHQWEYKWVVGCTEQSLNALGVQGWELAGYATTPYNGGNGATDSCILKRPK